MTASPAPQPGILAPIPGHARHLFFQLQPEAGPHLIRQALEALGGLPSGPYGDLAGIGKSVADALAVEIPGLKVFSGLTGPGLDLPATPAALWIWLRGEDRGDLLHRAHQWTQTLAPAFALEQVVDSFRHGDGRDLTGFEDGTENPEGEEALAAALVGEQGPGLNGGSFAAIQQWRHDFRRFEALGESGQDLAIGRRRADNEEIDDAPESAHVKRTAQESFTPEAFLLRRSMPWSAGQDAGLLFLAFGRSFYAFEAQLARMVGHQDGIVDGLFRFTRPLTGSYFWCPPLRADGELDLSRLGV